MRILLDTHIFIWVVLDDPRLNRVARTLIEDASEVYVSAVSIWEIAIKSTIVKIEADAMAMSRAIQESGFFELPVLTMHAAQVANLPLLNGHKDPFDRLLVAQSLTEPLVLLTADPKVVAYGGLIRAV